MSNSEQDDEFEDYLKRRVPIDKGPNQLEHLEPPPELDRIVIGKARKAIQGAAPIHLYRAPKWALPVGLAATILISFAILLDLGVRAKRNDASLHAERSAAAETVASPRTPEVEHFSVAPAANATVTAAEPELTLDRARTRLARAEKAAKRARPELETAAASTTAGAAAMAAPMPSGSGSAASDNVEGKLAPAAPGDSPAARMADGDARTSVAPPAQVEPATPSDPAAWLARIGKLRAAGHTAEAESEMKRFRATYPEYPLPKADR